MAGTRARHRANQMFGHAADRVRPDDHLTRADRLVGAIRGAPDGCRPVATGRTTPRKVASAANGASSTQFAVNGLQQSDRLSRVVGLCGQGRLDVAVNVRLTQLGHFHVSVARCDERRRRSSRNVTTAARDSTPSATLHSRMESSTVDWASIVVTRVCPLSAPDFVA